LKLPEFTDKTFLGIVVRKNKEKTLQKYFRNAADILSLSKSFENFLSVKYPEDSVTEKKNGNGREQTLSINNFEILKKIGQGYMGQVLSLFFFLTGEY